MDTVLWILAGILAIAVLAVAWLYSRWKATNNLLVALNERCDTAFSDTDVHLRHRHNLIPPLVEVIKGMTGYEKEMVFGVINARTEAVKAMSGDVRLKAEGNLTAQVTNLLANIDKFPELRAMPEFSKLRQELTDCENRITASRRFHNLAVEEYNTTIRQFPASWIAQKRRMNSRRQFDLGVERVLLDEPIQLAF